MTNTQHKPRPIYRLDPDFRRKPDTEKPYCCRCQKPLANSTKKLTGIPVTVNWGTWEIIEGHNQPMLYTAGQIVENELIGADCWKQITSGGGHE